MNKNYKKYFDSYLEIRNMVDSKTCELEKLHKKYLTCKSGCDMCCMDYSIFPVEYYAILNQLKKIKPLKTNHIEHKNSCLFLEKHKCSIYSHRPIICRTHGLPLLYTNEEGEWELAACELNFVDFDFGEFSIETTFPQDRFNSKLFILNQKFIADFTNKKYDKLDLIPLKQLLADLSNN